ncbi:hypothetical protein RFI_28153 [Reticulomyxa filosa]|uniref:Uncharacterized protein n=1 Tax=Reticulomyxa filosa TaxID=46433 RepID=X6M5G8_RETFI|nr:hypothetical protein RFI_28153 [Reticulomyxa filosa]|eukprot:ETO09233.1 hypothetical protein RFI_28153 [Reticulomyxa filosa]
MALKSLRCVILQRPGIYVTHSKVIQPWEHTLVNDGLPLLLKRLRKELTEYVHDHVSSDCAINFVQCPLEDFESQAQNKKNISAFGSEEERDETEPEIVLNHPKQYEEGYSQRNLKLIYPAISKQQWYKHQSEFNDPRARWASKMHFSTCLDYYNEEATTYHNSDNKGVKCEWRVGKSEHSKQTSLLYHPSTQQQLLLFHSNHMSIPLASDLERVIRAWKPDTLVLESDFDCLHRLFSDDHDNINLSDHGLSKYWKGSYDIGASIRTMWKQQQQQYEYDDEHQKVEVVLTDWTRDQYKVLLQGARILDLAQSQDCVDTSSNISLLTMLQFVLPSQLLPKMSEKSLKEYYGEILPTNNPHYFHLFEKKNDIFSFTLNSLATTSHGAHTIAPTKILGVFGTAHVQPIIQRLTELTFFIFFFLAIVISKFSFFFLHIFAKKKTLSGSCISHLMLPDTSDQIIWSYKKLCCLSFAILFTKVLLEKFYKYSTQQPLSIFFLKREFGKKKRVLFQQYKFKVLFFSTNV